MPTLPLVIAHRGASALAPEHTLAAYEQALHDGADGWECDVRMTMDGHLVCVHDRKLHRTSNGRGAVARQELVELQRLDFVSWKPGWAHPASRLCVDRGVLTLHRLLEFFVDCGSPLRLLIETKHPSRYRGHVEYALVSLLRRFGLQSPPKGSESPVVVMSQSPSALRRIRLLAPRLPTVQLFVAIPPRPRSGIAAAGGVAPIVGPWLGALRYRPDYVARAHGEGKQVFVWPVDKPADVAEMARLGVDAVITNQPKRVREQLNAVGRNVAG